MADVMGRRTNWRCLVNLERNDPARYEDRMQELVEQGILNYGKKRSFYPTGCGLHIGPAMPPANIALYFKRRKDAVKYTEKRWGGALFDVGIIRVD